MARSQDRSKTIGIMAIFIVGLAASVGPWLWISHQETATSSWQLADRSPTQVYEPVRAPSSASVESAIIQQQTSDTTVFATATATATASTSANVSAPNEASPEAPDTADATASQGVTPAAAITTSPSSEESAETHAAASTGVQPQLQPQAHPHAQPDVQTTVTKSQASTSVPVVPAVTATPPALTTEPPPAPPRPRPPLEVAVDLAPASPRPLVLRDDLQDPPIEKKHRHRHHEDDDTPAGFTLAAGGGLAYALYRENLSDLNANYKSLLVPSWDIAAGLQVTDNLSLEASYRSTQIQFDNTSVNLASTKSQWRIASIEGSSVTPLFARDLHFLWGLQVHDEPLALFQNGSNTPVVRTVDLFNLSLGGSYVHYANPRTRYKILMRAQYPLFSSTSNSNSSFSFSSPLIFDGSLGLDKNIYGPIWAGFFWLGQFQSMQFTYNDSQVAASGRHTSIFSTGELRFMFEF